MVNPVSLFYTVLFPRFVCVKLCNLTEIIVILSLSSFFLSFISIQAFVVPSLILFRAKHVLDFSVGINL